MQKASGSLAADGSLVGERMFLSARIGGGVAVGLGASALLGWCTGIRQLATFGQGYMPMAPSTALELVLFGVLVSLAGQGPMPPARKHACSGAAVVGALAAVVLGSVSWCGTPLDMAHLDVTLEELFNRQQFGLMSPLTALCFLFVGASLAALPDSRTRHSLRAFASLGLSVLLLVTCTVFALAYLYGSPLLYEGTVIPPALPTVLGLAALGSGLLDLARQSAWPPGDEEGTGARSALAMSLVFVIVATAIVTAGYLVQHGSEQRYRAEVEGGLAATLAQKADELHAFRQERLEEAQVFHERAFADLVRALDAPTSRAAAMTRIESQLKACEIHPSCDRVVLLDARGAPRLAVPPPLGSTSPVIAQRASEAVRSGEIIFQDYYRDEHDGRVHLALLVPVGSGSESRTALGVVVMYLDPAAYLNPCLRRWPTPQRTGEVLLVRREGSEAVPLNVEGAAWGRGIPVTGALGSALAAAVDGRLGIVEGPDERNVLEVTCAYAVPKSPWFIVVHRTSAEVYGQLGERAWATSILVALLLAGTAMGVRTAWRNQRAWHQWEQTRADEAMRDSERRLREMLEGIQLIAVSLDREGTVTFCNEHLLRLTGWTRDKVLGRNWFSVFVPGGKDVAQIFADCMKTGTLLAQHRNPIVTRDGRELLISWSNVALQDARGQVVGTSSIGEDITEREMVEREREATVDLLRLLNENNDAHELIRRLIAFLKELSGCEAVGIRLRDGDDYPYFETVGFPERFVQLESRLCARDRQGQVVRDDAGNPVLECMCGNILCGRFDPALPFFTPHGSFWSNCTTDLLASTSEADRQAHTRNRCNGEGYESVALVPLRSGATVYGLIQFNDKRKGRFTESGIQFLERIADNAAQALSERRARQELRESEARFRSLLASSSDHIFLLDLKGRYVLSNERLGHLESPPLGGIGGARLEDIFSGDAHGVYLEQYRQVVDTAQSVDFEHSLPARDGVRVFRTILFPVQREGTLVGVGGIGRDITEFRRLSERLGQVNKMDAIGQLAGGVAHDFNNQLSGVMGYADLLYERLDDPSLKRYADGIRTAARRSADLTGKLLAFARKGQYQAVPVDMHHLIAETVDMLQHSIDKRIRLEQVLRAHSPVVVGDPPQLQNALLNLALNARDAMAEGGTLTFETCTVTLEADSCTQPPYGVEEGEYLQLSVSDTGSGMPPQVKEHLFEPFFTTKPVGRGTGMGLAAVYGTVKNHRGVITVYTEVGRGTTFRIHLPLAESEAPLSERGEGRAEKCVPSLCIMVVDDEEVVRGLVEDMLCARGHRVILASDGHEASDVYRERWREIDLVLLDMVMPRLGGRDTFRALKEVNPQVKALLSSGFSIDGEARAILSEGVLGFVGKPFTWKDLEGAIARAVEA